MTPTQPLAWGGKVGEAFRLRVYELCDTLDWSEDHASWLMAAMAFETGRTFSPSVRSPKSSAVGLIQFMSATAQRLGTTTQRLAAMSAVEQLYWVERYFQAQPARIRSLDDLYMAILWPAAVGQGDNYPLWRRHDAPYSPNRGLDVNQDGRVTRREASDKVRRVLNEGLLSANVWRPALEPPPPGPAAPASLPPFQV